MRRCLLKREGRAARFDSRARRRDQSLNLLAGAQQKRSVGEERPKALGGILSRTELPDWGQDRPAFSARYEAEGQSIRRGAWVSKRQKRRYGPQVRGSTDDDTSLFLPQDTPFPVEAQRRPEILTLDPRVHLTSSRLRVRKVIVLDSRSAPQACLESGDTALAVRPAL